MITEKENQNVFKFSLYQGDVLFAEKIFDADLFNPFTRYSIDIRDILPKAITRLQKTLSKKSYDVVYETGRIDVNDENSPNMSYNLYQYHQSVIHSFPSHCIGDLKYNPPVVVQQIENKVIRGVEFKIGLYINDKTIVERLFYVDGFNAVSRWSVDIVDAVVEITDQIFDKIKNKDIKNIWDDYDLINYRGLSFNQVRELSPALREEMLRKIKNN